MNSDEVIKPPIIEELMEKLVLEHTSLNNQYIQLLNALRYCQLFIYFCYLFLQLLLFIVI